MKLLRYGVLFLVVLSTIVLQSCGSGGSTDTSGSLTLSPLVLTNNNDGTYTVAATETFTPPAGKSPAGVVIHMSIEDSTGATASFDDTLTSLTTSFTRSFFVVQSTSSIRVVVTSSIGDMSSAVIGTVPALAPVSATAIQFIATDVGGASKTSTISGGIAPYTLVTGSTADLTVSLSGSTLTVILTNTPVAGAVSKTQNFTISDANGNTGTVTVTYF